MIGHKKSFNKFKKIEIISRIFSDHKGLKLETNKNELTTIQNLWNTAKAVLRGKFIAIQAYLKRIETAQINNLTTHLQELKQQQQRKPRASKSKEITKIRGKLNDIETKFF